MEQTPHLPEHSPQQESIRPGDEKYIALFRMTRRRKQTPCPDSERCWNDFKGQIQPSPTHSHKWQLCLSTLAGAAAMLAGVLLFQHFSNVPTSKDMMVALAYDNSPQQVMLKGSGLFADISSLDSLSFLSNAELPKGQEQKEPNTTGKFPETAKLKGMQTLSTPRGMDFKVTLSDGTEVWLNAESTLEFPSAFTGKNRKVKLKGEAYFKVAQNEEAPFIVTSEKMNIRVLGTEFNFRNYNIPHVSLIHGSVDVSYPGSPETEARLTPGQSAWCDEQNHIRVKETDTYAVTQWTGGLFYFDQTTLLEILQELGRWYNLGVVFQNPEHAYTSMHFSALRTEDINQAIRHLNRLQKGEIKLEGKNLVVY